MAEKDTAIQAGESRFPATAWSLLSRLRDPRDPRVQEYLNRMMQMYWRPIYKYVRIAWKRIDLVNCDAPLDGITQPF